MTDKCSSIPIPIFTAKNKRKPSDNPAFYAWISEKTPRRNHFQSHHPSKKKNKKPHIKNSAISWRCWVLPVFFMVLSYKKQEKAFHPLARGTQKHAVLGNLKGTVTKPADDRRQQIELRIFLRSPDSPRADLNALPMQNSVTVRRQICRGKGRSPPGPKAQPRHCWVTSMLLPRN